MYFLAVFHLVDYKRWIKDEGVEFIELTNMMLFLLVDKFFIQVLRFFFSYISVGEF